jgi:hypothetical protein
MGLFSEKQMKALQAGCPEYVRLEYQCHGDIMRVPMGWAHAVLNLRPCIKVAFDVVEEAMLPMIALMQTLIGSAVFGQRSAEDYGGVFARIPAEIDYMLCHA